MKLKKIVTSAMAVTLVGGLLAGCGNSNEGTASSTNPGTTPSTATGNGGSSKQELVMNYRADPPALDVSLADAAASFTILGAISEGLYRLDENMQPQPALAAELPKISEDGLTYTIKLREGLQWANGDPLTAKDFVYSYNRTLDPATKADYAFFLKTIKGGQAVMDAKTPEEVQKAKEELGVKAIDDTTLEITIEQPTAYFASQLAFLTFYPQNEKFVEAQGDQGGADADKVLGAGPFILTRWNHEQQLILEKNPKYWDAANVKLNKVTLNIVKDASTGLNLYETGKADYADISGDDMAKYEGKPDLRFKKELTTGYLNFQQTKTPGLKNKKIRQALGMAIDRSLIPNLILKNGSVPATGYVPNGNSDGNGQEFRALAGDVEVPFDVEKAKQLLAEGLAEEGLTALPTLEIISDDTTKAKQTLENLVIQWKANLGIIVNPQPLPHATRVDREAERNFDITSSLWGADYDDPMTWLDMYLSDSAFNRSDWSNAEYDKLVKAAQKNLDNAERSKQLIAAEKILMDEAVIYPLYFRQSPFVVNPKVQGLILPTYGVDFELKWTSIK